MKKSLFRILMVFAMAVALALPVAALARGGGRHNPGERMDQMMSQLSLTTDQQTLLKNMKSANMTFMQAERADREEMEKGRRGGRRGGGRDLHRAFNDKCTADSPDFFSVASELKNDYNGQNADAFAAAADATAAFYTSLTSDQREQLVELHEQMRKNRGDRGQRGGRFQE